jgi:hydrogenase maturation factor
LKISLPAGQRTSAEAIAAICQKINERNNEQTNVAVVPVGTETDPRLKDTVAVGGTGIAARKLLAQALVTPHGRLNWRMFFEAGGYTLHVFAPSE